MKLIIDTNLIFSSISKSDGRIAEIILNPNFHLQLTGCYFSYIELFKYGTIHFRTNLIFGFTNG